MRSGCTAMRTLGINDEMESEKKENICTNCTKDAKAVEKLNLWPSKWLVPEPILKFPKRWIQTKIAKYAAYELLLEKKIESYPKNLDFLCLWKERYKRLLEIYPTAEKILKDNYDAVICYNSLYGVHRLFNHLSKRRGIPLLSLSHSNNFSKEDEFTLLKDNTFNFLNELRENFDSNKKLTNKEIKSIKDHSAALLKGKKIWNYSAPMSKSGGKRSNQGYSKKVLICLSSPDENFAADLIGVLPKKPKGPFSSQIEWLHWVRNLSLNNPSYLYWIRPHPRLYPNRREGQVSELAERLEVFRRMSSPPNFFWPEPEEQGSLWSHLKDTNVVFNAWSSIGDEFGKNGIPVVTFFPEYSNSGSLIDHTSTTQNGYKRIHDQLVKGVKENSKQKAYLRWIADYLCANTFNLQTKPNSFLKKALNIIKPKNKETNYYWCLSKMRTNKRNIENIGHILYKNISFLQK
jgi:hypothetical protein